MTKLIASCGCSIVDEIPYYCEELQSIYEDLLVRLFKNKPDHIDEDYEPYREKGIAHITKATAEIGPGL